MNSGTIKTKKTHMKGQWVFQFFNILYHFHQLYKLYKPNLNFWAQLGQNTIVPNFGVL